MESLADMYGKPTALGGGTVSGNATSQSVTDSTGASFEVILDDHGNPIRTITQVRDDQGKLVGYQVSVQGYQYSVPEGLLWETRGSRPFFIAGEDGVGLRYTIAPAVASDWQSITTYDYINTNTYQVLSFPGNVTSQTDAAGRTTRYSYDYPVDADGNQLPPVLLSATDPYGNVTSYHYYSNTDPATGALKDSLAYTTNALGESTCYSYAAGGVYTYGDDGGSADYSGLPNGLALESWRVVGETKVYLSRNYYFTSGDHKGELWKTVDAAGVTTEYVYSFSNGGTPNDLADDRQVTEVRRKWTDGQGNHDVLESHTETDLLGRVRLTRDANGKQTKTDYNALGQVSQTTDQYNSVTFYDYNGTGQVIRTRYADGAQTVSVYDAQGRVEWTTDRSLSSGALPNGTHTFYDSLGRAYKTERVSNLRVAVEIDADIPGNDTIQRSYLVTSGTVLSSTQSFYNDRGEVIKQTGPDGQSTRFNTVNGPDQAKIGTTGYASVQTTTDALGHTTQSATDVYNATAHTWTHQSVTVDALGHTTTTDYDALGRAIKTTYADGSFTETLYGNVVDLSSSEQPSGVTALTYVKSIEQRPASQLGTVAAASQTTIRYYNAAGRLVAVMQPDLDGDNNFATGQVVWRYEYDASGNQTAIIDPRSGIINANWNPTGATIITHFTYNDQNQRTDRTLPDGKGESWTHDGFGRLETHVDFKGDTTVYLYFDTGANAGRLHFTRYFAPGQDLEGTPTQELENTYDAMGRLQSVLERENGTLVRTIGYAYDLDSRVTMETLYDNATGVYAKIMRHAYDPATGRLTATWTAASLTIATDLTSARISAITLTEYGYDALGRLETTTLKRVNGNMVNAAATSYYDAVGNLDYVTEGNGITEDYIYDSLNRLTNVVVTDAQGDKLFEQTYTLESDGQRDYVIEKRYDGISSTPTSTVKTDWTYDAWNRLTMEVRDVGNNGPDANDYKHVYTLDPAGNRLVKQVDDGNNGTIDQTTRSAYDVNDRLLGADANNDGDFTDTGDSTYTYDANGSTTQVQTVGGSTVKNLWDVRSRLIAVDNNGDDLTIAANGSSSGSVNDNGDARYAYTDTGDRITKEIIGTSTTHFVIDASNPTGYAQVLEERASTDGSPTRTYVLGQDVHAQINAAGVIQWLEYDGHGSTRLLTDASSVQITGSNYDYDAFGNALFTGTVATNLLYTGEYWDAEKGSYFLRGRPSYNPMIGRFDISDPRWEAASDPSSPLTLHKYLYANANPIYYTDPSGWFTITDLGVTMGNIMKQMGTRVVAAYNVYDKAETIKDATVLIARFTTTGAFDPISAAVLLTQFVPFGNLLGKLRFAGKYLTGASNALGDVYTTGLRNLPLQKVSELVGEVGAGLVAMAKNYIPTNFPRKYHGIESVFEDGGKLIIVEAKGGAATLAESQMSKGWINQKIQRLIDSSDPLEKAWGNKLRTARDSGNLQGMVVTTRIDHAAKTVGDPEFLLKDWSAIGPSSF